MGIVYCDLQPEHVMIVDASGAAAAVKIMDFGLAEVVDSGTSAARLNHHHHRPGSLTQKRRIIHEGSQAVGRAPYQFRNILAWRRAPSGRDAGASDQQTEENIPVGIPPAEARRQAVLKFGHVETIRESYDAEERL